MSDPVADPFANEVVWEAPTIVPDGPAAEGDTSPEPTVPVSSEGHEPSTSEPGDVPPVADADEETAPEKPSGRDRLNLRFSELTQQRNLAQQEAEYWKNRALQSSGTETTPPSAPQGPVDGLPRDQAGRPLRPRQEQYATTGEYEQALDVYEDSMEQWRLTRAMEVARAQVRQETAVSQARQQFADYDQVVGQSRVQVNPAVSEALTASPQMHALLYHLATHPELERELAPLRGAQAFLAVARLEVQLNPSRTPGPSVPDSQEPPPRLPAPPPPIQPTRANGERMPLSYDDMSWEQFQETRNKEQGRRQLR